MNNHRRITARFRSRLGSFGWKFLAGSLVSVIGVAKSCDPPKELLHWSDSFAPDQQTPLYKVRLQR
jgi:hypothetical protein